MIALKKRACQEDIQWREGAGVPVLDSEGMIASTLGGRGQGSGIRDFGSTP